MATPEGISPGTWFLSETLRRERESAGSRAAARAAAGLGFYDWVTSGGFIADREPVNFDLWRVLGMVYRMFPRTRDEWKFFDFTGQKPTQHGFTIMDLLAACYFASGDYGNVGFYLPTADLCMEVSGTRFVPLVQSNPTLARLRGLGREDTVVDGEDSKSIRQFGSRYIFFSYVGGRITTESRPLDLLIEDEVQEMRLKDMQKLAERLAASEFMATIRTSTPNIEGADINHFYEESDQRSFRTDCRCPDGVGLADAWHPTEGPTCIALPRNTNVTPGLPKGVHFYVCPTCSEPLGSGGLDLRVQQGRFIAAKPDVIGRIGVTFGQMCSPRQTAAQIYYKWATRVDTADFFRRVLARPYTDPSTVPITQEVCEAAEREDLRWEYLPHGKRLDKHRFAAVFLGVDHMKHDNHLVVKAIDKDTGRMRYLWLEVVQGDDPFTRTAEVMRRYRVDICALEELPNLNETTRFAKAFPGKVFIAHYQDLPAELVAWGDRPRLRATEKRTDDDARLEYTVGIDQYRMMSWSLGRWTNRQVDMPPARQLTQAMRTDKGRVPVPLAHEFWKHLQHVALVTEYPEGREDEHRLRRSVKKIRIDPHFAFANMLCDVAIIRRFGTEQMLVDEEEIMEIKRPPPRPASPLDQLRERLPDKFPQEPPVVFANADDEGSFTCGGCTYFQPAERGPGRCLVHRYLTTAEQPGCDQFEPKTGEDDE